MQNTLTKAAKRLSQANTYTFASKELLFGN